MIRGKLLSPRVLGATTLGLADAEGDPLVHPPCPSSGLMSLSSRVAAEVQLTNKDPRWVGAWWLGFLVAASLVALSALPYFFFPREMPKEVGEVLHTHTSKCQGPLILLFLREGRVHSLIAMSENESFARGGKGQPALSVLVPFVWEQS